MKILVINGPNLNMLGIREPDIYGHETYDDLVGMIRAHAADRHELDFYQSNHEGDLVERIQQAHFDGTDAIVINPGAYTHTSIALLDAAKAAGVPLVEVHISDPTEREEFRHVSYIGMAALASIRGRGFAGYNEAIDLLERELKK